MNKISSKKLGELGEKIASFFLERKAYKILDRNYSPRFISGPRRGEIDIVAEKDENIIFFEVKTLGHSDKGIFSPEEKVNYFKQKKIIKTAEDWLRERKIPLDRKWQIDIIAIRIDSTKKKAKLRHFKNAIF